MYELSFFDNIIFSVGDSHVDNLLVCESTAPELNFLYLMNKSGEEMENNLLF